jgi:hypothetical protein
MDTPTCARNAQVEERISVAAKALLSRGFITADLRRYEINVLL